MRINLKLGQKVLILVAVPVIFEASFVTILFGLLRQADLEVWREMHSKAIIAESNDITKSFMDCVTALMGYHFTGQEAFYKKYNKTREAGMSHLKTLELLTLSNQRERELYLSVDLTAKDAFALLTKAETYIGENKKTKFLRKEMESVAPDLINTLNALVRYEREIADSSPQAQERSRQTLFVFLFCGIAFSSLLAVLLAIFFNRSTTNRLNVVIDNTHRMAKSQQLTPRIGGADEIAQLDNVFHDMAQSLEEAARNRQELISMVSHDLRSPLSSIQASLGIMRAGVYGELTPELKKYITAAESNTSHLIRLINDLLDVERLEAGKMELFKRPVKLEDIVETAFTALNASAQQRQINLVSDCRDIELMADKDRLGQVIINLLGNAIKFSDKGTTVTVSATTANNGEVTVKVKDQGRGIPASIIDKIFERYQQTQRSDAKYGTGLGLAICKAIVESHGGEIGVVSIENEGAEFWFRIPGLPDQKAQPAVVRA